VIVFGYELSAQFFDVILSGASPSRHRIGIVAQRPETTPFATPAASARDDEKWSSTAGPFQLAAPLAGKSIREEIPLTILNK
jgi:hypothetical protein